jgi:hypothetical protein
VNSSASRLCHCHHSRQDWHSRKPVQRLIVTRSHVQRSRRGSNSRRNISTARSVIAGRDMRARGRFLVPLISDARVSSQRRDQYHGGRPAAAPLRSLHQAALTADTPAPARLADLFSAPTRPEGSPLLNFRGSPRPSKSRTAQEWAFLAHLGLSVARHGAGTQWARQRPVCRSEPPCPLEDGKRVRPSCL